MTPYAPYDALYRAVHTRGRTERGQLMGIRFWPQVSTAVNSLSVSATDVDLFMANDSPLKEMLNEYITEHYENRNKEDDSSILDSLFLLCNIIDVIFVQPAIFLTSDTQLSMLPFYIA
ncbi:unnamed protein product [Oppiella nova]|uniref:Uncharacterized protein n=1 Tax=Oppiella nova TaxID=334625 RepID=A0A7R9QA24_9ACAR|nr:unnamed protein product [Oppiella nova]CAG2161598.1 unnamed protein product [Oppiella nova]